MSVVRLREVSLVTVRLTGSSCERALNRSREPDFKKMRFGDRINWFCAGVNGGTIHVIRYVTFADR